MLLKYSRRADEFAVAPIMLLYEYRCTFLMSDRIKCNAPFDDQLSYQRESYPSL